MNINVLVAGPLLCVIFISACGSDTQTPVDTSTEETGVECPDVVYYDDPLVRVVSVIDSSSDDSLIQVTFSELTIEQRNTGFLSTGFDGLNPSVMESLDISSDGQSAICTIPCGLFTFEAEYSMVVSAPAFESKLVEFEPTYKSDGGPPCRNRYSGSYELSIALDPDH